MIIVYCVNNKGQRFEKTFNSYYAARIFILRCKHGKNVQVLGFDTYNEDCHYELYNLVYNVY